MTLQHRSSSRLVGRHVPELNRLIEAAEGQGFALRAVSHRLNRTPAARKQPHHLARPESAFSPQANGAVLAARGHGLAVRREGDGLEGVGMPFENRSLDRLAFGQVPYSHRLV